MISQTILYEGKKYNLLPFSFLDKVGGAIIKHFGKEHSITLQMHDDRKQYGKRGIYYATINKYQREPAFALATEEINFLRKNYEESQEIF